MATSSWLMAYLIVVYVVIALVSLYEGNIARAWYWAAAGQITASVLLMGIR